MTQADITAVTEIHLAAFTGFFLSFLGPAFLRELYDGIVSDPSGIAFVCENHNQLVGFVAGSDRPSGLYGRLLRKRAWRFTVASSKAVLRRPSVMTRLVRAMDKSEEAAVPDGMATLMSIAVTPEIQGSGAGKLLVREFLEACRQRGVVAVNLTTDATNNAAVNAFYSRQGFELARTFVTREGRAMNEYIIQL